MSDWSGSGHRPDILDFVPMDWRIGVDVRDFELLTFVNQCNWIDVASPKNMKNEPENCKLRRSTVSYQLIYFLQRFWRFAVSG